MANCQALTDDPFRCPTKWEIWQQLLALLPPGRAWQNHESCVELSPDGIAAQVGSYELGGDVGVGFEVNVEQLTTLQQFWAAFAQELEFVNQRACSLLEEFFCATVNELREEWWIDYGFPDPCDPYRTLCAKVSAQGGATCEYLAGIAADRGWLIECSDCEPRRSAVAGCASAGCAKTCGCPGNTIWITVNVGASPAYTAPSVVGARAGAARAGNALAAPCPPGADALQCLIERFKPAHVRAVYLYEGVA